MKAESTLGEALQSAHMLTDWDAIAEQNGMRGPRPIGGVVDVICVDANERNTCIRQILRCLPGEERMIFEILIRAPMSRPARMD